MRFFHTLFGAFSNPATYRATRAETGYGLGYSFLLVVLSAFLVVLFYLTSLHFLVFASRDGKASFYDDALMQIANQLPLMTLQNGQLKTKEPRAYTIFLNADAVATRLGAPPRDTTVALATIDTTGGTTYKNMPTAFVLTAHDVMIRDRTRHETKIQPIRDVLGLHYNTLVVNHSVAIDLAERISAFTYRNLPVFYLLLSAIAVIGLAFILYVARLLMQLIVAGGGLAISHALDRPVSFATAMRLAAVSYTPVAILSLSSLFTLRHIPVAALVACGLVMFTAALVASHDTPLAGSDQLT